MTRCSPGKTVAKRAIIALLTFGMGSPLLAQVDDRLRTDWAGLNRYRAENAALPPPSNDRVVFMGNSITEGWAPLFPTLFPGRPYIGRGISGQTTPQMLVRFRQDVVALKPKVVVILAGTNDIAGNTGPSTIEMIEDNLASMSEIAAANGIRVVLSSVLPVDDYPWKRGLEPAPKIMALNAWMKQYAATHGAVYLDFHSAMQNERHGMKRELTYDGVHPNEAGYRAMAPLAERAIADALRLAFIAPVPSASVRAFERDLEGVRTTLRVSGMTAAIVSGDSVVWRGRLGFADIAAHRPMNDTTAFPIASLTKTMSAAVVMQLAQEGRLSIDSLWPVLSHTSEGRVGEEYLYSGARYNTLGGVIERASGASLGVAMRERIFRPLTMERTSAGSSDPGGVRSDLAAPYASVAEDSLGTKVGSGHFPGIAAANGVVSTSSDLARYAIALMRGDVVGQAARVQMWTPRRSKRGTLLPYGLGWFVQDYGGERLVWHYGQESSYGSLLLLIPSRRLGLVVLANSNSISDAARLLDGNVARSLVAQAFLRDVAGLTLPASDLAIARALAELYLGHRDRADTLARSASNSLGQSGDLSLFYLLFRLADPSLDPFAQAIEKKLLEEHPHLAPLLYFAALFEERAGASQRAAELLERIATDSSPPRHWSVVLGLNELGRMYEAENPTRARWLYQKVVEMNYNFGGAADRAKQRLLVMK